MKADSTIGACDTPACCCMDIGTVIDGSDCAAVIEVALASAAELEPTLTRLTTLANSKASEPVVVAHELSDNNGSPLLRASFTFPCQAEALIFQLAVR